MKTAKSIKEIPPGQAYIKIDVGNEFLYVYGINHKAYVEVSHSVSGKRSMLS